AAGDTQRLMSISAELAESNADFEDLLGKLAERLHQLAVANALNDIPPGSPDFSAEEVQLYYQLVLLGQRDINLAPEPRSGFEMTLLRMLAFAPGAESRVPARAGADTVKKSLAETPADTAPAADAGASAVEHAADEIKAEPQEPEGQQPEGQQPEVKAEVVTDPAAQIGAGLARWYELVTQLQIGGVTKMVADNCILLELDLPRCKLVLDARHETLLSDAQQKQLQRALSETLEQQVELSIEVAEVQAETPARRNERLAQERQQAAEREIAQDPNVASLLSDFGASVVEVRPN
ncbi:MAG: DNA polymerase III subunit gamma/tau C-terminal domain-containing protein, partial [Pseudomonadales bacterium]